MKDLILPSGGVIKDGVVLRANQFLEFIGAHGDSVDRLCYLIMSVSMALCMFTVAGVLVWAVLWA